MNLQISIYKKYKTYLDKVLIEHSLKNLLNYIKYKYEIFKAKNYRKFNVKYINKYLNNIDALTIYLSRYEDYYNNSDTILKLKFTNSIYQYKRAILQYEDLRNTNVIYKLFTILNIFNHLLYIYDLEIVYDKYGMIYFDEFIKKFRDYIDIAFDKRYLDHKLIIRNRYYTTYIIFNILNENICCDDDNKIRTIKKLLYYARKDEKMLKLLEINQKKSKIMYKKINYL